MKKAILLSLLTLTLAALPAFAQVPGIISHQGKVTVNGINFAGTGQFKFALVNANGSTTYWSNDGTSTAGSQPTAAVSLTVARGIFSVNLGDTAVANMTQTIPASVFANSEVYLRVWFNDGTTGWQLLTPDRRITSVGYALNFAASPAADIQSSDITTWNAKVGGSGTANYVPKFTASGAVGNSALFSDASGKVGLGTASPSTALEVVGTVKATAFSGDGSALVNIPATSVNAPPPGMALIPTGPFTMGNSIGDSDISDAVPVTADIFAFYMDVNLVTLSQWQSVYYWATDHGYTFVNAGAGKAANHPVQTVDWYDCVKWCNARSQQAGLTPVYYTDSGFTTVYKTGEETVYANWSAKGYRLPTEAEWEKAARGGLSGQRFPWGNMINQNLANYYGDTASYTYDLGPDGFNAIGSVGGTSPATSPVGSFAANGYGLYDMAGNVAQLCWDWYGTPYAGGYDPRGPASGSSRVVRSTSWADYGKYGRTARRADSTPDNRNITIGFRSVLSSGQN